MYYPAAGKFLTCRGRIYFADDVINVTKIFRTRVENSELIIRYIVKSLFLPDTSIEFSKKLRRYEPITDGIL